MFIFTAIGFHYQFQLNDLFIFIWFYFNNSIIDFYSFRFYFMRFLKSIIQIILDAFHIFETGTTDDKKRVLSASLRYSFVYVYL